MPRIVSADEITSTRGVLVANVNIPKDQHVRALSQIGEIAGSCEAAFTADGTLYALFNGKLTSPHGIIDKLVEALPQVHWSETSWPISVSRYQQIGVPFPELRYHFFIP